MARQSMTPPILFMSLLIMLSSSARPQQMGVPDSNAKVDNPAYPSGKGRIAVFGEAAAFTAQLFGRQNTKRDMNNPAAKQNCRFVLSGMHWLSSLVQTQQTETES